VEFKVGRGYALKDQGLQMAHVIVASSYAVIISVTDVHFHVLNLLVKQAANPLRLVERALIRSSVPQRVLRSVRTAQPRKSLVAERVNNLHLVVKGVSQQNNVLLGDKVDA